MNSLFSQIPSCYSTTSSILLKSARSLVGPSSLSSSSHIQWKRTLLVLYSSISTNNFGPLPSVLSRFGGGVQCYSTKRGPTTTRKKKPGTEPVMEEEKEKEAYFVVRKGDVVGVYKSLSDCQPQVGSSICDPPVSVYKGHSLPSEAEEYLVSRGLQNALYTIKASDIKEDLFGTLVPCLFQEPAYSKGETSSGDLPQKRPHDVMESANKGVDGFFSTFTDPLSKLQKFDHVSSDTCTCLLEFDGASKGNPGPAGAGAVLRSLNGNVVCKIRQGLGTTTNNVAEYRALILGLRKALEMGYTSIRAKGDSKLVCMQLQGLWKVKNQNMSDLHAQATILKDKFSSFRISHILRDLNNDADTLANMAVSLADGQIKETLG